MATLYAGTSGFAYPAWRPAFYPEKLPARQFLPYYAGRLSCVEINYSFRRTPAESTLEGWATSTPDGFAFAMKAHQRITHVRRLEDVEEPVAYFLRALEPLRAAGRLGPVLFQLPPNLKVDLVRLATFLRLLPEGRRSTMEFRHESWFTEEVFALLGEHDVALCQADTEKLQAPEVVTASFVYRRLRRPDYTDADLRRFAAGAREQLAAGRDTYLIFKHEESPQGALQAERVLALVRGDEAGLEAA
jgi:uncharacterized protein YecE (DUF72 family)